MPMITDQKRIDLMDAMLKFGLRQSDVARAFKISRQRVHQLCKQHIKEECPVCHRNSWGPTGEQSIAPEGLTNYACGDCWYWEWREA